MPPPKPEAQSRLRNQVGWLSKPGNTESSCLGKGLQLVQLEDHRRDVIVLMLVGGEAAGGVVEAVNQLMRGSLVMGAYVLDRALRPEFASIRGGGLGNAIGQQHHDLPSLQRDGGM